MKKIMILGAGTYQVPLIRTAKRLGIYTIVVSIPGNYPGFAIADKVYYENTTDWEKILEIAKEEKIDGIITAGTDVAVITIGKVCDELGLCGLSYEGAKIATNKLMMKTVYEKYGVRTAKYRKIAFDNPRMFEIIDELTLPLIFKAVDSSGSRGITRVNSREEFEDAIACAKKYTRQDYFIVEEFIEGEEYGAQAFVYDGKVQFIMPHGDYVFHGNTGVPIGHWVPYELDEAIIEDTRVQLELAIKAMGLNNCAINADFILKDNKAYVLEIGGRSGATCLAESTSIYYGFDYYEKILLAALGEKDIDFTGKGFVPNASHLLMSDRDGIVRSIVNENEEDPNIYEIQFDCGVGDEVNKFRIGPHRIGHVVTKGETLQEAVDLLEKAMDKIKIEVE